MTETMPAAYPAPQAAAAAVAPVPQAAPGKPLVGGEQLRQQLLSASPAPARSRRPGPGHNRKRTWSAPAGTVELIMSTAAAAAAAAEPAAAESAAAAAAATAGSAEPSSSPSTPSGLRRGSGRGVRHRRYVSSTSHSHSSSSSHRGANLPGGGESYDDFDEDGLTSSESRNVEERSSSNPGTPPRRPAAAVEEADRGGGHTHRHSSTSGSREPRAMGESSFPDLATPPRHYNRRPRTHSDGGMSGLGRPGGVGSGSAVSPSVPRILHGLSYRLSRASSRGRHRTVGATSPDDGEPSFVNDDDDDDDGGDRDHGLAMPSLGVANNSNNNGGSNNIGSGSGGGDALAAAGMDSSNDGGSGSNRDARGRIRRSVSARTLINLGRLGGVETVLNGGDRRGADSNSAAEEPLNVDLQQIAAAAADADDDMIADVAQTSMARQAALGSGGGDAAGNGAEQETLVKELIAYFRHKPWKKKVLMLTVIGSVIWVVVDFATTGYIRSFLATFVTWMERNPVGGFFVFIIFFILTTLVFIPPSILTLGSGVAFSRAFGLGPGVVLASSSSFFGACIGAVIAFFRARYLMRDLIKLFARRYPVVKATDRAIKHKGFRIYLLLRMCPVIPFNALNYIGGITGVKWQAYTFALIGILPWQIVLVFIGATVGSVNNMHEDDQNSYNTVSITIGCVFSVISLLFMWYYARKELKREIAAHQEVEPGEDGRSGGDDVESQSNNSSASSSLRHPGSTINDPTGVSRRSFASLTSLQGFSEFEAESTAEDGSVAEGEDEAWYWIWT